MPRFYSRLLPSLVLPAFFFLFPSSLDALSQNKIIGRTFPWQIRSSAHFDVYYYGEAGTNLLPLAARYLENGYDRATAVLPARSAERAPFFLYNTHNEFEETNITAVGEGTGGVTEAFKDRLLVGHIGSQRYLEYVIAHEFTHKVEFEYLFSGFWRSVRLLKFIVYPNWLMEGLAEYVSGDLDRTTYDMYLRDAATGGRLLPLEQLHSFNHVLPHQVTLAYKESEALMRYIAEEYGADKLPALLASYRERFDAESVLADVLKTDLFTLDEKFREHLRDTYSRSSRGMQEPSAYGEKLTRTGTYPRFYESAVFSPDGASIAYVSDEQGYRGVFLMELATRRPRELWGVNRRGFGGPESVHAEGNALSFSPDGRYLAFCGRHEQKDRLYLCELASGRVTAIDPGTDTAASPAFSPDGTTVYFSGMRGGFRDIYAFSLEDRSLRPLTAGPLDEIDAAPDPSGKYLLFAAERPDPGGRVEYDLCSLDLASGATRYLTASPGDERYPCVSPDGKEVYFTSDQDGVRDIYSLDAETGKNVRLTRVIGGNFQPRVQGGRLLFSSFRETERHLYLSSLSDLTLHPPESGLAQSTDENNTKNGQSISYLSPLPGGAGLTAVQVDTAACAAAAFGAREDVLLSSTPARPYRFRASTDLFFPAIFYSSLDGFYVTALWQASDLTGDNLLQVTGTNASAAQYLDYQLTYGFLKYRTQVYLGVSGKEYFTDSGLTHKRTDDLQSVTAVYPLNRFRSIAFTAGTIGRRESIAPLSRSWQKRENVAGVSFLHDTVLGPYLEATSGSRVRVAGEFSERVLGGDYRYQNYFMDAARYIPLGKEHALGLRAFLGGSFGDDAELLRLGGEDRVRGLPASDTYAGTRVLTATAEWRIPLAHNINYHMWYIFPDFFFKTLYGSFFVDTGVAWDRGGEDRVLGIAHWKGGYGVALRCHTFILQSFPLLLNLEYARRTDSAGGSAVYFGTGTSF